MSDTRQTQDAPDVRELLEKFLLLMEAGAVELGRDDFDLADRVRAALAGSPAAEVGALRQASLDMVAAYGALTRGDDYQPSDAFATADAAFLRLSRTLDATPTDSGTVGRAALDPAHIEALEHVIREYERVGQVVCFPRADGTPDTCGRLARQTFVLLQALTGMRASGDAAHAAGEDGHA